MQEVMNHHKWLVENNLLTDEMKDNVAMGAWCLIENVVDAATFIDFHNKVVHYRLLLPTKLTDNLKLFQRYKAGEDLGFFEMRRLKKFLEKKKQNDESGFGYQLDEIANRFVKGYFTKDWSAEVNFKSVDDDDGRADLWLHSEDSELSN